MSNHIAGFITKVCIENFPSRTEIYELLSRFLNQNKMENDVASDNKDLVIIFSFKNPVIKNKYNPFLGYSF